MFSATLRCGYSAYDWNTIATSRSLGGTSLTTRSLMLISPPVTGSSPAIIRSRVDLPQPDGPTSTRKVPLGTDTVTSRMTFNIIIGLADVLQRQTGQSGPSFMCLESTQVSANSRP